MADKTSTTVVETELDLDTLLAQPGAESVLLPGDKEEGAKNSVFSRKPVDLTFLDKPIKKEDLTDPAEIARAEAKKLEDIKAGILNEDGTPKKPAALVDGELDDVLKIGAESDDLDDEGKDKGGRRKTDKNGLLELTKKLIEKKLIIPFEGDKPVDEYTPEEFLELYEANDAERKRKLEEEVPGQFFDSLPDKMKYAAKYIADGGTDLEALFSALGESERVSKLDASTEGGSEAIVRQYLQATNFGDADEIQEEIDSWKDRKELEAKAAKFKPKLEAMQEQFVQYKVQEQEKARKIQQEEAQKYMKNIYEVLEPGELNGIKLDKKTQSMLYSGLTQPSYPSLSGKQTNLLGHLLEKYQWVEPNHGLIAEAVWLLADPEGYKSKLRESGKTAAVIDAVKKLKTEESRKLASTVADEGEDNGRTKGLKRPSSATPFFKR